MTQENAYELGKKRDNGRKEYGHTHDNHPMRPYSLAPNQMECYFGFKAKAIYDLVNSGRLHRGYHYLKIGRKTAVICDKFIEWMEETDGSKIER